MDTENILKSLDEHFASMTEEEKEREFMEIDMKCNYSLDFYAEADRKKYKWLKFKEKALHILYMIWGFIAFIIPVCVTWLMMIIEYPLVRILVGLFLILIIILYILFRDHIFPEELIKRQ